jgi:acyl-coenzyme A synthetase/AMP-(fatty) acid ligase
VWWDGVDVRVTSWGHLWASAGRLLPRRNDATCAKWPQWPESAQSAALFVAAPDGVAVVTAILAGLRAGVPVVPVDATWPPAALAAVRAALPVKHAWLAVPARLPPHLRAALAAAFRESARFLEIQDPWLEPITSSVAPDEGEGGPVECALCGDVAELAVSHVYFTSGSTGAPKPCVCSRAALAAYCDAKNAACGVSGGDAVVLAASAHTFDPLLGDVVSALLARAAVALMPRRLLATRLADALAATRATHLLTTPALLEPVPPDRAPPSLRVVALGGERMPSALAAAWAPTVRLLNVYGVTECVCYQAVGVVRGVDDAAVLDGPLAGSLLLVRALGGPLRRVEDAVPGEEAELVIAGAQVGLGYAGDAAGDARFFLDAVFGRCYSTGDVVAVVASAVAGGAPRLELRGRLDRQVKLGGRRTSLEDMEAAARRELVNIVADVRAVLRAEAAVADLWIVLAPAVAASDRRLAAEVARAVLRRAVPAHWMPHALYVASRMPLNASGKVDAARLRERAAQERAEALAADSVAGASLSDTAALILRRLVDETAASLGLSRAAVAASASFSENGGSSLLALRVSAAIAAAFGATSGGTFGEHLGVFAPARLLRAASLRQYAEALAVEVDHGALARVDEIGAPADAAPDDELSVAAVACVRAGDAALLDAVLTQSARADALLVPSSARRPLLHLAAALGLDGVFRVLLSRGAAAHAAGPGGSSLLHAACEAPPARAAAAASVLAMAASALRVRRAARPAVLATDDDGQTPLHVAARRGAAPLVFCALVGLADDANARDSLSGATDRWGRTALHWAVVNGHLPAAEFLVRELGLDGSRPADHAGETPLAVAHRRALCSATDRPDGEGAATFSSMLRLFGMSGRTIDLRKNTTR